MTLGSGAMTNPISDITNDVDVIMLVGSNPEEAHPVIGMQIRQAVERGTRLIVVDPRDIGLSRQADIHLKLKPGTNVAFANGMMNVIIHEGLADEEFIRTRTEGFEELKKIVEGYTPERVAEICHIDADHLREAALMYAKAKKAPIIYCLGVTEHSTGTEVDTVTDTAGRRHTDLQCVHEIFIGRIGFLIACCQCSFLRLETLSLVDGVI